MFRGGSLIWRRSPDGQHVTLKPELEESKGASSEVVNVQGRVADLEKVTGGGEIFDCITAS
jgi:hypothetical protein